MSKIQQSVFERLEQLEVKEFPPMKSTPFTVVSIPPRTPEQIKADAEYAAKHNLPF